MCVVQNVSSPAFLPGRVGIGVVCGIVARLWWGMSGLMKIERYLRFNTLRVNIKYPIIIQWRAYLRIRRLPTRFLSKQGWGIGADWPVRASVLSLSFGVWWATKERWASDSRRGLDSRWCSLCWHYRIRRPSRTADIFEPVYALGKESELAIAAQLDNPPNFRAPRVGFLNQKIGSET